MRLIVVLFIFALIISSILVIFNFHKQGRLAKFEIAMISVCISTGIMSWYLPASYYGDGEMQRVGISIVLAILSAAALINIGQIEIEKSRKE